MNDKRNPFMNVKEMEKIWERTTSFKEDGDYYYLQEVDALEGPWVYVNGQKKLMFATYNYLGLLGDERINQEAMKAIEKYGTGTHGVRIFGGSLDLHGKLESKVAEFTNRKQAMIYSTGYMTNLSTINAIVGKGDWIFSDKLNHASIVDGCLLSTANHKRFKHNDMNDLERLLAQAPDKSTKLVIADAVFSMDGDVFNLPKASDLCKKYNAILMIDEAHSLGILGRTGHGIEEHFGLENNIDIKMGTFSKAIPAIGGYISSNNDKLINYLKHSSRGFVFSAAMPAAVAAAALKTLEIIETEGSQIREKLQKNVDLFIENLQKAGFDTGNTETPIIPVMLGVDEMAMKMATLCQENNVFALPVVSPAVPMGKSRLRVNVTAAHEVEDIIYASKVIIEAGKRLGIIK